MTDEPLISGQPDGNEQPVSRGLALPIVLVLAVVVGLLGYWLGTRQASRPGASSAEVGFARDMMQHHAQAVDMAALLRDRTDDPALRQIALDIQLTQQAQIGQMQGWLHLWGYPLARTGPAMAWMGMPTTGSMPGMATPDQLNELRGLDGEAADVLFLQLMIPHHAAGVQMAQAVLERAGAPAVSNLAQSIVDAQTSEIEMMQELLQLRGFPPVPVEDDMGHSTGEP